MEIQYIFFAGSTRAGVREARAVFASSAKRPGGMFVRHSLVFARALQIQKAEVSVKRRNFPAEGGANPGLREEIFRRAENSAFGRAGGGGG